MAEIAVGLCFSAELFGMGVRRALTPEYGFRILGEACSTRDVLRLCAIERPDTLLLDLDSPDHALFIMDQLDGLFPCMSIVVFGGGSDEIETAAALGATAHLPKSVSSELLRQTLHAIRGDMRSSRACASAGLA